MRRDRCVGSANGANQASILARTVARANRRGAANLKRDWLKTRTVCPSRTVALGGGLKRACGDRARGGEAGEPPSPRVPSTVLDRARRARGRSGWRDGGRAPRGEARDARLRGAGDAARAGGHHAFNELGFFRAGVRVESRGETTERASRGYTNATRSGSFPRRRDAGVEARVEVACGGTGCEISPPLALRSGAESAF